MQGRTSGLVPQVRRWWSRLRRLRRELAPPRRTVFRWLRTGPRGEVALGRQQLALERQPTDRVVVGTDVRVGDHVDVHLGPRGRLEIGAGAVLGDHVQIAADELVRVGPGCRLGAYAVLTDTWTYGRRPREVPGPPPASVVLGAGVVIGARAVIGPGVHLPAGTRVEVGALRTAGLVEEPTGRAS